MTAKSLNLNKDYMCTLTFDAEKKLRKKSKLRRDLRKHPQRRQQIQRSSVLEANSTLSRKTRVHQRVQDGLGKLRVTNQTT